MPVVLLHQGKALLPVGRENFRGEVFDPVCPVGVGFAQEGAMQPVYRPEPKPLVGDEGGLVKDEKYPSRFQDARRLLKGTLRMGEVV